MNFKEMFGKAIASAVALDKMAEEKINGVEEKLCPGGFDKKLDVVADNIYAWAKGKSKPAADKVVAATKTVTEKAKENVPKAGQVVKTTTGKVLSAAGEKLSKAGSSLKGE
jgi:hypothetical protein